MDSTMSAKKDFAQQSHTRHEEHYKEYEQGEEKIRHARSWLQGDTVDAWLKLRLMQSIDPLLEHFPSATWVTVGDGRFAADAQYINSKGGKVLATDISDVLLKQAKQEGYIKEYKKENAEALSFQDGEFDFVFCKESYHHFPRPLLSLHEMLRVATKAVILVEPNDHQVLRGTREAAYKRLKEFFFRWVLQKRAVKHEYEEVGNYIYTISRREIEKVALGLNYPVVVFKYINTYYIPGVEYEKLSVHGPLWRKVSYMIWWRDLLTKLKLKPSGVLVAMIFKTPLDQALQNEFKAAGFVVDNLPRNPYLNAN
jgi:SAM-dependent methyltransferase